MALEVDRIPGRHERGDVGDRVVDGESLARSLDENGLIEIQRIRRVDRDELQRGEVQLREPRVRRRLLGRRHDVSGELLFHVQLVLKGG